MLSIRCVLTAWCVFAAATAPSDAGDELSATELLGSARAARSLWIDFPGFEADVRLQVDDVSAEGRLTLTADGEVKLRGFGDLDLSWATQQLESLARHRFPDNGPKESVVYADQQVNHPLGRLVLFAGDVELESAYRIQGDVVAEVNRVMGANRFTISVLSVHRNDGGKYLPATYAVNSWDKATGELQSSETYLNEWRSVAGFDLPTLLVVVRSSQGARKVLRIELQDHCMLPAE